MYDDEKIEQAVKAYLEFNVLEDEDDLKFQSLLKTAYSDTWSVIFEVKGVPVVVLNKEDSFYVYQGFSYIPSKANKKVNHV